MKPKQPKEQAIVTPEAVESATATVDTRPTNEQVMIAYTLLEDIRQIPGVPAKALTEILLLRSHYKRPASNYMADLNTILSDQDADEETKGNAAAAKFAEHIDGFAPRKLTADALEQITSAAITAGIAEITSGVFRDDKGQPLPVPLDLWLQHLSDYLVYVD